MSSDTGEFLAQIGRVRDIGEKAVLQYGSRPQTKMAAEECGELIVALMQHDRGRVTSEQVVEEAADVIITAVQVGLIHDGAAGVEMLTAALKKKLDRLQARLEQSALRRLACAQAHGPGCTSCGAPRAMP